MIKFQGECGDKDKFFGSDACVVNSSYCRYCKINDGFLKWHCGDEDEVL